MACARQNEPRPFFPLLLAAEHSEKLNCHSIAVAFAAAMNLANIGHDQRLLQGSFYHGLGFAN